MSAPTPEPKPVVLVVDIECVICARRSDQLCVRLATGVCTKCQPIVANPIRGMRTDAR